MGVMANGVGETLKGEIMTVDFAHDPWVHGPSQPDFRAGSANNRFAQAIFDARDILLPKGAGKGGQRRRVNSRALLFTIVTQGEWSDTPSGRKNGLWWTTERIALTNGIGLHQTQDLIEWFVSVGLIKRKRQFNGPNILWVDFDRLREIVQRQSDDRTGHQEQVIQQREAGLIKDNQKAPEFDPDDLEEIYFMNRYISEALDEAPF
jgi:hypothetical protein